MLPWSVSTGLVHICKHCWQAVCPDTRLCPRTFSKQPVYTVSHPYTLPIGQLKTIMFYNESVPGATNYLCSLQICVFNDSLPVPPPHVTNYLPATVSQASKFIAIFELRWLHISQTGRRMQSLHQASAHSHLSTFWAHSSTLEQDRATVCLKTCPQFKRHALYSTSKRIQATLITCLWTFFQLHAHSPLWRSKFIYKLCATIYFQQCLLVSRSLRGSASGQNFWEEVRENRLHLESAIPEALRDIALHD